MHGRSVSTERPLLICGNGARTKRASMLLLMGPEREALSNDTRAKRAPMRPLSALSAMSERRMDRTHARMHFGRTLLGQKRRAP